MVAAAGGIAAAWALNVYNSAPPLSSLKPVQKGRTSAIYTADGSLIGYIHSDNVRQPIPSSDAAGDAEGRDDLDRGQELLEHGALDYEGIARAVWKDVLAGGKPVQGASTITQQLVRNLYIRHPEDTLERKIKEAHLAEELFEEHSRNWILNTYLNTAPYGTNEGQTALGVEAAAQTYFSKPAKELNLTEAALIAGLPQAPSEYNPFLDPKAALQRRNEVLGTMVEQGYITRDRIPARRAPTASASHPGDKYTGDPRPVPLRPGPAGTDRTYGINTVRNGGLKAYTTIDPELQAKAEAAVAESCTSATPAAARPPASPRSTRTPARSSPSPRPRAKKAKKNSTTPGRRTASPGRRSRPTC